MESDEELYNKVAKEGCSHSYTQLYERYERPLFAFIRKRVSSQELAEDIFHEAMLSILKFKQGEFAKGGFAAWIYRVSLNLCINQSRYLKRNLTLRNALELARTPEEVKPNFDSGLEAIAHNLPAPLRQTLALRMEGKKYQEIERELGIPVGTLKSRMNTVVKLFRKRVGV